MEQPQVIFYQTDRGRLAGCPTPFRAKPGDAGLDLHAVIDEPIHLVPGRGARISTEIQVAIPEGWFGWIADRSSLGTKGLKLMGGIIDSGYRGILVMAVRNIGDEIITINPLDRVAQLIIIPCFAGQLIQVENADDLGETERGAGGFGSTDSSYQG